MVCVEQTVTLCDVHHVFVDSKYFSYFFMYIFFWIYIRFKYVLYCIKYFQLALMLFKVQTGLTNGVTHVEPLVCKLPGSVASLLR